MSSSLLRELREDDAEQVAALFVDGVRRGAAGSTHEEIALVAARPRTFEPELAARARGGRRASSGTATSAPRERRARSSTLAAPGRWDALLDWAEAQARPLGLPRVEPLRPARPRARARSPRRAATSSAAHSFTMEIELDEPPREPATAGGLELRAYRDDDRRRADRTRINDAFARGPVLAAGDAAEISASGSSARAGFDPALWFLALGRRRARRLRARLSRIRHRRRPRLGRLARRSQAVATARPRPKRSFAIRSPSSTHAASVASASASTRRTSPARCDSTSASACTRCAATASGRRNCERAPRTLPRLPHAHRGRRSAPSTSATRAAASSPPGSCACRRRGATAARRWPTRRSMELPWPEAAVVEEPTLDDEIARIARELPARPLLLGGSCCGHVGAVRELARRHGRIGVVWIDSHGDLNTPESSPTGQRVGDAAPDADRRRRRRPGGRDPARCAQPRPARGRRSSREAGIRQELGPLPDRRLRRARPRRDPAGRPRRVHAGARRPDVRASSKRLLAALPTPIGAGFTGGLRTERNEALLPRLGAALGL